MKKILVLSILIGSIFWSLSVSFALPQIKPKIQTIADNNLQQTVMFNTQTHKYHKPSCAWAKRCTKHCIPLTRSEAIQRGGTACKVCGG